MTETAQPKFSPGDMVYLRVTGERVMILREDRMFRHDITTWDGELPDNPISYLCRTQNLRMDSFMEFELEVPPTPEEKEHLSI